MRLLAVAGNIDATIADIRLRTPLAALAQRNGWPLVLRSFHDCARADIAAADVLIVQRGNSPRALRLQQAMHARGGAVIYEIDDLLTEVAPHLSQHAATRAALPWLHRCLAQADGVTVSTARLGRELGMASTFEVPNCAAEVFDAPAPSQQPGAPVTLLFASSDRLATPFIYPAVRALQAVRAGVQAGVQVVVVGPPGMDFEAAGLAVRREPLRPRADFIAFARSLPNVLGVIPLEETRFAACKSAVKWFDYAAAGIPTLCSDVSPYREVIESGRSGVLVPNDELAWTASLQAAAADAGMRQALAEAARAAVRERHTLAHSMDAWQFAIESALAQVAARPPPALGLAWRLREAGATLAEGPMLALRRINRERLARRQRR